MSQSLQIICAGFTEMFNVPIKTRAELEAQGLLSGVAASSSSQTATKITVNQLFELTYRVTMSPAEATVTLPSESDTIGYVIVKFLQGNTISVPITHQSKVSDVQKAVAAQEELTSKAIRLIYGGVTLTKDGGEDMELRERGIGPNDVISALIVKVDASTQSGLSGLLLYIDNDLLDPSFDYDFTNINDGATRHMRGGYQYKRPCGWKRFALRVLGVYGDDKWLNSNIGGDWPVSYHGIQLSDQPAKDSPNEKTRQIFGKGHYSSPSVLVAQKYGTEFTFQGVKYSMVLQNRVNPHTTRMIPQSETGDLDEYWITANAEDIRAYSICIKTI